MDQGVSRSLILAGLLALTAAIYAPLRSAPFVYEDSHYASPAVWRVPSRALAVTSVHWTGTNAGAAHVVNVGLHLVNGTLVYGLGAMLVGPGVGVIAAGIYLLHPLSSEAVSYIGGRPDLLVTLFTLLAVALAVSWTDHAGWYRLAGSGLAVLGASMSKEIGVIAVPLVVVTLLAFRGRLPQTAFLMNGLWCGLGLAVGASASRINAWVIAPPNSGGTVFAWPEFATLQAAAIVNLCSLVAWPFGRLSIDHDVLMLPFRSGAWVLLVGLCALAAVAWRKQPVLAWSLVWWLVVVAPRFVVATSEFTKEYQIIAAMPAVAIGLATWIGR